MLLTFLTDTLRVKYLLSCWPLQQSKPIKLPAVRHKNRPSHCCPQVGPPLLIHALHAMGYGTRCHRYIADELIRRRDVWGWRTYQ